MGSSQEPRRNSRLPIADREDQARGFYNEQSWVESDWIELIAVEYEELLSAYPFPELLSSLAKDDVIRLLDIGCGTGIFPRFLDPRLDHKLQIRADLLDQSSLSLSRCHEVLGRLSHFEPQHKLHLEIESIPQTLNPTAYRYDIIWALHSLTTVDRGRMPAVLAHVMKLLVSGGRLIIYQLAASSTYQRLHSHYREHQPSGRNWDRYMQAEDTIEILHSLGLSTRVTPLSFEHVVPSHNRGVLENYLRKCVLDESIDALGLFGPLLEAFMDEESGLYRFPQTVHLIEVGRE